MRIEHLEYFTKVVECGSITTAATQLFISPQGLSQAIKQLEKELDIEFFTRSSNNFSLTTAGQLLYDNAQKILAINDELHVGINQLKSSSNSGAQQRLHIYATHIINCTFLPQALIAFHKKYPSIGTRIWESNSKSVFDDAENRGPAITFFGLPLPVFEHVSQKFGSSIEFQIFAAAPLQAVFSKRSPLANRKSLDINEIARHPLVLYITDNRILQDLFGMDMENVNIIMSSTNIETCRTVLANDDNAIGFTNTFSEKFMNQTNVLTTKPIQPTYDFVFGYFLTGISELPHEIYDLLSIIKKLVSD